MEEVARLIGVELNEEFELVFDPNSTCHATIKLTTDGVKIIKTDVYDIFNFKSNLLEHLLKGNYGIKKNLGNPNTMRNIILLKKMVVLKIMLGQMIT